MVLCVTERCGAVLYGVWLGNGAAVWFGMVRYGLVWFGMVRYGMGGYSEDKWVLTIRIMARAGWH